MGFSYFRGSGRVRIPHFLKSGKFLNTMLQKVSLRLNRRYTSLLMYSIAVLYAVSEGYLLVSAFEGGKLKTIAVVLLIPLLIVMMALLPRIPVQTLVGSLLALFWIPAGFNNWSLYLFEILLYGLLALLIIKNSQSEHEKIKFFLNTFPWLPFLLYITGALITWSVSARIGGELNEIRAMCILPLALSLVIFLATNSREDAERFLWILLTSAAILGLIFLVGQKFFGFISLSNYGVGSGRLSMRLTIPYSGSLEMLPQSTANWYGYLLVFAYSLWIFHPSSVRRTYAFFLCVLYGYLVISTQGRGGALQAVSGALILSVYATLNSRSLGIKGIWLKFALVCLVVMGGIWYMATQSTNTYFNQHGLSLFNDPLQDTNLQGRFERWSNGLEKYLANPILGIGLSAIETPWGPDTSEVLNYLLLNLLGYGLLGFLGLMLILSKFLAAFWRGIRSGGRTTRMLCIASIGAMLGFFLGVQPEEPYSTVIVWAPLIIAYISSTLQDNRTALSSISANGME